MQATILWLSLVMFNAAAEWHGRYRQHHLPHVIYYQMIERTSTRKVYGPVARDVELKWQDRSKLIMEDRMKRVYRDAQSSLLGQEFFNFDEILPRLYLGRMPRQPDHLEALAKRGVTQAINLLQPFEYREVSKLYNEFGIDELRLPTGDHLEPSVNYLLTGFEFLYRHLHLNQRDAVYVHCKGGRGRSAAVVFVYLAWYFNQNTLARFNRIFQNDLDRVQRFLSDKRPHVRESLAEQPNIQAAVQQLGTLVQRLKSSARINRARDF